MKRRQARVEKALEVIAQDELEPGKQIPVTRFEEVFGVGRNSKIFGLLISEFRRALYSKGFYLSGENSSETGVFEILSPLENQWVAQLSMIRAERDLTGKMVLMENTDLSGFSRLQKGRHENTAWALSLRVAALQRAEEIAYLIARKRPTRQITETTETRE
jgi:hypothetical protein